MDWLRLIKAIGIMMGLLGLVAGMAWLINTNLYIVLIGAIIIAFVIFIIAIYRIIGE